MIDAETIRAAKKGDTEAWKKILNYYRPYINACCKRTYIDKFDNTHTVIDKDMVEQIESKLMLKVIMNFNIDKPSKEMLKS